MPKFRSSLKNSGAAIATPRREARLEFQNKHAHGKKHMGDVKANHDHMGKGVAFSEQRGAENWEEPHRGLGVVHSNAAQADHLGHGVAMADGVDQWAQQQRGVKIGGGIAQKDNLGIGAGFQGLDAGFHEEMSHRHKGNIYAKNKDHFNRGHVADGGDDDVDKIVRGLKHVKGHGQDDHMQNGMAGNQLEVFRGKKVEYHKDNWDITHPQVQAYDHDHKHLFKDAMGGRDHFGEGMVGSQDYRLDTARGLKHVEGANMQDHLQNGSTKDEWHFGSKKPSAGQKDHFATGGMQDGSDKWTAKKQRHYVHAGNRDHLAANLQVANAADAYHVEGGLKVHRENQVDHFTQGLDVKQGFDLFTDRKCSKHMMHHPKDHIQAGFQIGNGDDPIKHPNKRYDYKLHGAHQLMAGLRVPEDPKNPHDLPADLNRMSKRGVKLTQDPALEELGQYHDVPVWKSVASDMMGRSSSVVTDRVKQKAVAYKPITNQYETHYSGLYGREGDVIHQKVDKKRPTEHGQFSTEYGHHNGRDSDIVHAKEAAKWDAMKTREWETHYGGQHGREGEVVHAKLAKKAHNR